MLQKILTGTTIGMVLVLLGLALFLFLQGPVESATAQSDRTASDRPEPGGGRMRMAGWFDDMEKAYKENDREKMGQLLEQMKQARQRFGGRGGPGMNRRGPGRGDWGPGMGGRGPGMGSGGRPGGGIDESFFMNPLSAKVDSEKKILSVLDDIDKNQR